LPESISALNHLEIIWIENNPLNPEAITFLNQLKEKGIEVDILNMVKIHK
jgi:hypothetical protein